MNVASYTSDETNTHGGNEVPPCIGPTPDALPEVQTSHLTTDSHTGVSTSNVFSETAYKKRKQQRIPHWYALRATYGREKQAYDYLVSQQVEAYHPTITSTKVIDGKKKPIEESRIPNIFFARGTEEELKSFVYDNANLPHLRFYYRHRHEGARIVREPLIVPDQQMDSLKIICAAEATDILFIPSEVQKFRIGQTVRIMDGPFKGVIGKVARYQGQQRVAVTIEGVFTIASAFVPSAFLERIQPKPTFQLTDQINGSQEDIP